MSGSSGEDDDVAGAAVIPNRSAIVHPRTSAISLSSCGFWQSSGFSYPVERINFMRALVIVRFPRALTAAISPSISKPFNAVIRRSIRENSVVALGSFSSATFGGEVSFVIRSCLATLTSQIGESSGVNLDFENIANFSRSVVAKSYAAFVATATKFHDGELWAGTAALRCAIRTRFANRVPADSEHSGDANIANRITFVKRVCETICALPKRYASPDISTKCGARIHAPNGVSIQPGRDSGYCTCANHNFQEPEPRVAGTGRAGE